MSHISKVEKLISKGKEVLNTYSPPNSSPNSISIGMPNVDQGLFTAWRTQTLNFLRTNFSPGNTYSLMFEGKTESARKNSVKEGISILEVLLEDLQIEDKNAIVAQPTPDSVYSQIENIFHRFHLIVRQLKYRHNNRGTLEISDEYDVQDLIQALLKLYFDDIRAEEWTPSYAGKSSRVDFLIKEHKIVIEIKKTRQNLTDREIGEQLIQDIARYEKHPDCRFLYCFVYDPDGLIRNKKGLENDLSKNNPSSDFPFEVKVIILSH